MGIPARHQSSWKCRWHHTDASLDTQSSDCSWKDWQQPELKRTRNSGDSGTRLVGTQMLLLLGKTLAAADGVKHTPTPTAFDPAVPLLAAFHFQRKWEQTCMYTRTHTHSQQLLFMVTQTWKQPVFIKRSLEDTRGCVSKTWCNVGERSQTQKCPWHTMPLIRRSDPTKLTYGEQSGGQLLGRGRD